MSKVEQSSTAFKKWTGCFSVFRLDVTYRTYRAFRMALVKFVTFVVLKILDNLVFMQNSLIADVRKIQKLSTVTLSLFKRSWSI